MALRREDLERLQRLLEARARLEMERSLASILRDYDDLGRKLQPLRKRALDALDRGDLDVAERAIRKLESRAAAWLINRAPVEREAILRMARRAAIRGAQSVDLAPLVAARPNAGCKSPPILFKHRPSLSAANTRGVERNPWDNPKLKLRKLEDADWCFWRSVLSTLALVFTTTSALALWVVGFL